ncbi:MAG: lipopolysaccharide biosynthesis protein, partial [Alphaproteobacteria bacterium]|nr:lipopolysaccharide biosynthesis protein [Alphaproteobacteria bacterium]
DHFKMIAIQQTLASALRLALVCLAFMAGAGLEAFLAIGAISTMFSHGIIMASGWRLLKRHGHGGFLGAPLRDVTRKHPKVWSFMWALNASALIRRVTREADTLIVGGVLGPTAAGLFHVAKKLGDAVLVMATPIQQVIYPDLARLWARGAIERFRWMVVRVNWLTGIGLTLLIPIVAFNIDWILTLTVGEQFVDGAMLVVLQLTAAITMLYGIANRAALQSMGKHAELLWVVLLSTAAFFTFFLLAIKPLGVISASLGHLLFNVVWLIGTTIIVKHGLRDALADEASGKGSSAKAISAKGTSEGEGGKKEDK